MADFKEVLHAASRQVVIGLGRIGARATARAYQSVAADVDTVAAELHRRTAKAKASLDSFLEDVIGSGEGNPRSRHK